MLQSEVAEVQPTWALVVDFKGIWNCDGGKAWLLVKYLPCSQVGRITELVLDLLKSEMSCDTRASLLASNDQAIRLSLVLRG